MNDQQGQVGRVPHIPLPLSSYCYSNCRCLQELRIYDWNISSQQFAEVMRIFKENNLDLVVTRRVMAEGD